MRPVIGALRTPAVAGLVVAIAAAGGLSLGAIALPTAGTVPRLAWLPVTPWIVVAVALLVGLIATERSARSWPWPAAVLVFLLLPWLPFGVPYAFLLWSGPLALGLWLCAGIGSLLSQPRELPASLQTPRSATIVAGIVSAVIFLGGYVLVHPLLPGGDEPHYLMISQSLLADGDLAIENNHRNAEYGAFFGGGVLKPDFLRRSRDGLIYSIHAPGLGAMILPAYALTGHRGAAVFLALVAAVGAALAWLTAFEATGDAGAAWFGWAAVVLNVAFVFHAFSIYPDAPASVLAITGVLALLRADRMAAREALAVGGALMLLPWLHTRYALLAGALGAVFAIRLVQGRRVGQLAAFGTLPVIGCFVWLGYFQRVYGTVSPMAPYGGDTQTSVSHIWTGLTGLFFDQQFGLLPNAPVMAWPLLGLIVMMVWRRGPSQARPGSARAGADFGLRRLGVELAVVTVPYILAVAAFRMWWGGWSAPARFLVPIILPLSIPAAVMWLPTRSQATRAMAAWMLCASLALTAVLVFVGAGRLAYNVRDGVALWAEWVTPIVSLPAALPSVHRQPLIMACTVAAMWVVGGWVVWLILRVGEGARAPGAALRAAWTPLVAVGVSMAAATAGWTVTGATPARPDASQLAMLAAIEPGVRDLSLEYKPQDRDRGAAVLDDWLAVPSILSRTELVRRMRLQGQEQRQRPLPGTMIALPHLPSGRYRAIASTRGQPAGTMQISVGRTRLPMMTVDARATRREPDEARSFDFYLPVDVASIALRCDPTACARFGKTVVQPLARITNPGVLGGPALDAVRYGPLVAYFGDRHVYPEPTGFWVRPALDAVVAIAADTALPRTQILVRSGPVENQVRVRVGTSDETFRLAPGEGRELVGPPVDRFHQAVLEVRAEQGFSPSKLDPSNLDFRLLGVWVEIR